MAETDAYDPAIALERAWREHWGRLLGLLVGRFRDVDLAEDALADAFEAAARVWATGGVPDNPPAWLLTAARRRGLDRIRAAETARRALPLLVVDRLREVETGRTDTQDVAEEVVDVVDAAVTDDELRLLFLACHPALAPESQAALALRLVLGLPTAEIARLFLVAEPTMAARITRAKKKVATAGIPFAIPPQECFDSRVEVVVQAVYLCFTAGYAPGQGEAVLRADLAGEAIRLGRLLRDLLVRRSPPRAPNEPAQTLSEPAQAVTALLALMLLQHSRRDARVAPDGSLVLLADQDRDAWHAGEIAAGLDLLTGLAPSAGRVEELRLQAVIAARHATAPRADATDWAAIARDYAALERLTGSPVVRLNRAVAVAQAEGPRAGLDLLTGLDELLPRSHRLPAVRGELLARAWRACGGTRAARGRPRPVRQRRRAGAPARATVHPRPARLLSRATSARSVGPDRPSLGTQAPAQRDVHVAGARDTLP
ncbi:RNA polymerase sigma factor [Salana multivorans]